MPGFQTIAVAGATGNTVGPYIVQSLLKAGKKVKVLTREAGKQIAGAESVVVDYENIESLTSALQGVEAVVSTIGGGVVQPQLNLITAAKAAGVQRFIPSEFGVDTAKVTGEELVIVPLKKQVADAVIANGLEYTLIVNGLFHTFVSILGFNLAESKVHIVGDGNARFSVSSYEDVGNYVAAALEEPEKSKNRSIYIDSDVITFNEAVQAYEKVLGKKLDVTYEDTKAAKKRNDHSFNTFVLQLQILFAEGKGLNVHSSNALFPQVKRTPFSEFVKSQALPSQ